MIYEASESGDLEIDWLNYPLNGSNSIDAEAKQNAA